MYKKRIKIGGMEIGVDDLLNIAIDAGDEIMKIYNKDFGVEYKDDKSPLTEADKLSHERIVKGLKKYDIPVLSEEGREIPYEERKNWKTFWMIDPLDGTKEFIKKNGEFTVNIALIHENEPVFGVVYAPAINEIYFTDDENAYKAEVNEGKILNIKTLPENFDKEKYVIVASKSHLNDETKDFIENIKTEKEKEFISKGSSLKLCMVAQGVADIYPRIAPTMEWDTAAADAVVRKSGKMTYEFSKNTPLKYNKENLLNPYFVVKGRG